MPLPVLNVLQLVLYIALLALVGQGVLYLLAGSGRDGNPFYRLLQVVSKPFTSLVRRVSPARVADRQIPFATFLLLLVIYLTVTLEKIEHCVRVQMVGCR